MTGVAALLLLVNTSSVVDSLVGIWSTSLETAGIHHVVARQELYWPLTGDRLNRTMELWFSPPHRVRVCYSSPDSQVVVADGAHVWTIVPGNNQVLVQVQDPAASWRDTPLGTMLSVESFACSSQVVHDDDPGLWVTCTAVHAQSEFTDVMLLVPEDGQWPASVQLVDLSGNITTYDILEWETQTSDQHDESLFRPTIPEGMEIVHLE